jgi:hypothetical protein
MRAIQGKAMHYARGVPRRLEMANTARIRAYAGMWRMRRGLKFGSMTARTTRGRLLIDFRLGRVASEHEARERIGEAYASQQLACERRNLQNFSSRNDMPRPRHSGANTAASPGGPQKYTSNGWFLCRRAMEPSMPAQSGGPKWVCV